MLELAGVRHAYEGRVVLDLERFAVQPGALIAIVGHNGSGKSTLLRLLALIERPAAGEVRWDGAVVSSRACAPGPPRAAALPWSSSGRCCSEERCGRTSDLGSKSGGIEAKRHRKRSRSWPSGSASPG